MGGKEEEKKQDFSHTSDITYCHWHHHRGTRHRCQIWVRLLVSASGHVKDTTRCMCVWWEKRGKDQVSGIKHSSVWSDTWDDAVQCHLCPLQKGAHRLTRKGFIEGVRWKGDAWGLSLLLFRTMEELHHLDGIVKQSERKSDIITFVTLLSGQAFAWPKQMHIPPTEMSLMV